MTTTDHIRFQVLTVALWLGILALLFAALLAATAQDAALRPVIQIEWQSDKENKFRAATNALLGKILESDKFTNDLRNSVLVTVETTNAVTTYRLAATLHLVDSNAAQKIFTHLKDNKDAEVKGSWEWHFCPTNKVSMGWLGCERDPRSQKQKDGQP